MDVFDLKNINLYELFDLTPLCTETEIKKAYRKKALIHHPDKNPNNPKANEIFQKLSKALEILTDEKARASYDKILRARKEKELRNKKFDAKRKRLKDELETKEKFNQEVSIIEEEEKLKQEIDRIRKEGSKQLEEENFLLKKKLDQQRNESIKSSPANTIKVKLKRNRRSSDIEITDDLIKTKFAKFGPILSIVKLKKSALLEYENYDSLKKIAADCPKDFEFEILNVNKNNSSSTMMNREKYEEICKENREAALPTVMKNDDNDYEDYIMKRMQEVGQKKRKKQE